MGIQTESNMAARVRSKAKSLDRSNYQSVQRRNRPSDTSSTPSRAHSDSRATSRNPKNATLPPIESVPDIEKSTGKKIQRNGPCGPGQDIYAKFLGPTADETILYGLQLFHRMGLTQPPNPGESEGDKTLPVDIEDSASRRTISSTLTPTVQVLSQPLSIAAISKESTVGEPSIEAISKEPTNEEPTISSEPSSSQTEYSTAQIDEEEEDEVSAPSQPEPELKDFMVSADSDAQEAKISSEDSRIDEEASEEISDSDKKQSGGSDEEHEDTERKSLQSDDKLSKSESSSIFRETSETSVKSARDVEEKTSDEVVESVTRKISLRSIGTNTDNISEKESSLFEKSTPQLSKSQKSILKDSSSSSKSEKDSSGSVSCTCTCSVKLGPEQEKLEQNRKTVCFCRSCNGNKKCSSRNASDKMEICSKCCRKNTSCKRITETDPGKKAKLCCDCYISTSSTIPEDGEVQDMKELQKGDGNQPAGKIKYAITKITDFGKFTTYEVMRSTRKKPKTMPVGLEGVFVLRRCQA